MARVDDMTAEQLSTYELGYQEGIRGVVVASRDESDMHYWQGFVMGRLSRGWNKAEETR